MDDTVTITVRREDAWAVALGPLEYVMQVEKGQVPNDGSPMRIRQALRAALSDEVNSDAIEEPTDSERPLSDTSTDSGSFRKFIEGLRASRPSVANRTDP